MIDLSRSKNEKIRNTPRKGTNVEGILFQCYYKILTETTSKEKIFFTINVPRKVKKAVDRNRIKRLVRESIRFIKPILENTITQPNQLLSLYIIYKTNSFNLEHMPKYDKIKDDITSILKTINQRMKRNEQINIDFFKDVSTNNLSDTST